MAFVSGSQPVSSTSQFLQNFYLHHSLPPYRPAMDRATSSNESSENEGLRSLSSRSDTGTINTDSMYSTSNAVTVGTLRPLSVTYDTSNTKYVLSKSYPSTGEFSSSVFPYLNATGIEGDYTNNPTFLEELRGNLCYEPEVLNSFCEVPNIVGFNSTIPGWWSPLNSSLHAASPEINNYSAELVPWAASMPEWPRENTEWSAKDVRAITPVNDTQLTTCQGPNSQPRYQGVMIDKTKSDTQPPSQYTKEQATDDLTTRCQENGCGKSFSRTADMKRHQRELHDPGQKRFVCGCCNSKPHGFKREEKLINHKATFHRFLKGAKPTICPECSEANALVTVCFCDKDTFERHRELSHGIHPIEKISASSVDGKTETCNVAGVESLSDETKSDKVLSVSTSKCKKRERQTGKESTAKRARACLDVRENNEERAGKGASEFDDHDSNDHTIPTKLGDENANSTAEEILVPDVGISDFYALSENKVIRALEEDVKLDSASGPAKPEISFNAFQGSIRLRGFGNVTNALQSLVYNLLGKRERLGSSPKDLTSTNLLCMRSKLNIEPQTRSSGTKIFAMRQTEDAELLKAWHEKIIPSLPDLLARTIGENYTVSLVRKGISEFSGTAVIQIQTHTLPSKTVRAFIRNQIVRWVNRDVFLLRNQVQFLKGRLTTLAGLYQVVDSPGQSDQMSEDNDESECYPFYKRYWRTPGPGASIGLLCTRSIAATICCYIHIEGRPFILTVKHFVTKSYDRLIDGTSDRTTVVSPALADVDDMRERLNQFVTDFKVELDEAMRNRFGDGYPEYVSFDDISSLPDNVQEIMAKLEVVRKDLSYLIGGDETLRLGSLAYQSTPPSDSKPLLCSHPGQNYGHHMDWAICSVDPKRTGTNRHRYMYNEEEKTDDFFSGETDTLGAGQPFSDTCTIEPNAKVHFVGQATGRQFGEINAARILVRHEGVISEEWGMITPASGLDDKNMIHKGDSGAAVIRNCDNKLGGMLWACTKNGQLIVSPINIVFGDIGQNIPATDVSLPTIDREPLPEMPLSIAVHEVDTICRDKTFERYRPRRKFRSSDMPSPRRKQLASLSNKETTLPRERWSLVKRNASLPTPLLNSQQHLISNPPKTAFKPILHLPVYFGLAQQIFRTLEDNKNKHPVGFVLSECSDRKLDKRPTFPPIRHKLPHRTGTWPENHHFRFISQDMEALNAISVN